MQRLGAAMAILLAGRLWAAAGTATVTVDVSQPGVKVSPLLYGIFFEEINRAGDGGLYAELLRNRGFEDAKEPQGWTTVSAAGKVDLALDASVPFHANSPTALKVTIRDTAGKRSGVAGEGFGGIPVVAGQRYSLSLALRAETTPTGLTATLESVDGKVLAAAPLTGVTAVWSEKQVVLTPRATDPAARLVVCAASPGTFWLDALSLTGATWRDRTNGLRPDLAEMLVGLKPAFVRFPGGCFVEGNKLANAFRWKDSIGPIQQRPGHWNLWGYRSTDGLGYHEYLQLCEDLGAEPLFVINCGMAHEDHIADADLAPWVQDALDAVEYANGPADSAWGKLRAAAGHPKPFGLKLMEIGNENGGPVYENNYKRFYDALKAKYPEVRLVANVPVKSAPMDIVDEHYYSSPDFFLGRGQQYDNYARDGAKIYVGEYAVTQGAGKGNLIAALGEAGFMCGMERNSDQVIMSSYAPLFVRTDTRQWNPDLIQFDGTRVCGTPSYYVQQLFARNRPEQILPAEAATSELAPPAMHGGVGVATWSTSAEFRDITVTRDGQSLLKPALNDLQGWRRHGGEWSAVGGVLTQKSQETSISATIGDATWQDYTYSLRARKLGGAEGFLIMFDVAGDGDWVWWNLGGWGNARTNLEWSNGGSKSEVGTAVPVTIDTNRWYDIKIETKGRSAKCYLDGKLIQQATFAAPTPLHVVAGKAGTQVIVKAVNAGPNALTTTLALAGVAQHRGGTQTVLASDSPQDENTLDQPLRVAPQTSRVPAGPAPLTLTLPAYSLTVLRLDVGR